MTAPAFRWTGFASVAGVWTVLDAPRLSTRLAWMNHAPSRRRFKRRTAIARSVTTLLVCRSLFLGAIGTRHNVAPYSALLGAERLGSRQPVCVSSPRQPCSGSCSYVASRLSSPSNPRQSWLFAKPVRLGFLSVSSRYHAPACSSFIQHMASQNWLTPILSARHPY